MIRKAHNSARHYTPPPRLGEVVLSNGIGQVVASKSTVFSVGDLVHGIVGWSEYSVFDDQPASPGFFPNTKINPLPGLSPSLLLGVLGGSGMTAYFGIVDVLKLQRGQSLVVSGAAGAVGSIVVQYAKHVIGASKLVAICGSNEKAAWVRKIGADISLNYKHPDFKKQLDDATEGFVDAYFDNVGGDMLDQMLTRVKPRGHIAACGAISTYNSDSEPTRLFNYMDLVNCRITLHGFLVMDYLDRAEEAITALSSALQAGKIDVDGVETLVRAEFEEIPKIWGLLFEGGNRGKLVTQIADLDQ